VQVNRGPLAAVGKAIVETLAGVFFQVHARYADSLGADRALDFDVAMFGQRLVVLRNLVALGQVGIEIVLAREDRRLVDLAVERRGGQPGKLNRPLVQHRQRARQTQTHRADIGVRRIAKLGRAAAEALGAGQQLDVDFQPDDRLVLGLRCDRSFRRGSHLLIIVASAGDPTLRASFGTRWRCATFFLRLRDATQRSYCDCMPAQSSGDVPKASANRNARSAETPARPFSTRDRVTRETPRCSAAVETADLPRYSRSTSPGCGGLNILIMTLPQ